MDRKNVTTAFEQEILLADSERQVCEVWTRVMGYHRPLTSFNKGKKSEHQERIHFQEKHCLRYIE